MRIKHGKLAIEHCNLRLELQVLRSAAGFYIGTFSAEEGPVSRESEYFPTFEAATKAMNDNTFCQRDYP